MHRDVRRGLRHSVVLDRVDPEGGSDGLRLMRKQVLRAQGQPAQGELGSSLECIPRDERHHRGVAVHPAHSRPPHLLEVGGGGPRVQVIRAEEDLATGMVVTPERRLRLRLRHQRAPAQVQGPGLSSDPVTVPAAPPHRPLLAMGSQRRREMKPRARGATRVTGDRGAQVMPIRDEGCHVRLNLGASQDRQPAQILRAPNLRGPDPEALEERSVVRHRTGGIRQRQFQALALERVKALGRPPLALDISAQELAVLRGVSHALQAPALEGGGPLLGRQRKPEVECLAIHDHALLRSNFQPKCGSKPPAKAASTSA
jgi:hypothetical protein